MRGRRFGRFLLVPLMALSLVGCGSSAGKLARARASRDRLPRVEVVQPLKTSLLRKIELVATVEALQRVDLAARVPGTVEIGKDIDIGKWVKKGEVLLTLDVPDLRADKKHKEALLEQARRQVDQAEEARAVAKQEIEEAKQQEKKYIADQDYQKLRYDRVMGLVRTGAQDKQLADEALRQLETAEAARRAAGATISTRMARARAADADLSVARRKVEVAEAEVKKLSEMITFATIPAPFDGIITKRWVDQGATIKDAGAPLLTVMEMHHVRVLIDIPQREEALVDTAAESGKGDRVVVRIPELAGVVGEGEFVGSIERLSKALDPVTRTMRAEVELENPLVKPRNGRRMYALRPGMFGRAEVFLDERSNVLTIPGTAVVRRGEGHIGVYVVAHAQGVPPRGELKFVDVALGLDDGQRVEVRSGLKGDELVVARGSGVLRVGDEVLALPPQDE